MKINLQDALDHLQEMRHADSDEGVANALYRLGVAYLQRKRLAQAEEAFDEAQYLCEKLENHLGLAHVLQKRAELALATGDGQAALAKLDQVLAIFRQEAPPEVVFQAVELRARALDGLGRTAEAAAELESLLAQADHAGDEVSALLLLQYLAPLQRRLGQPERALATYRRHGALAEKLGEPQRVALAYVAVGSLEAQLGRPEVARGALGRAAAAFLGLGMAQQAREVRAEMVRLGLEDQDGASGLDGASRDDT